MTRFFTRRRSALVILAILCLAGIGVAGATDYSKLSVKPSETAAKLKDCAVSLLQATEVAQKHVGGIARSVEINLTEGGASYLVSVFTDEMEFNITVDATSGEVTASTEVPYKELPGDPVSGEMTTTSSGLSFYEITEGTGEMPASSSTEVEVHYSGWLTDGTKFDSSVDRGRPTTFPLNRVISGWTEGVGSMKVGGKRKLIIPYELAYGAGGRPPTIPPKALLIFDVELLRIVK